MFHPGICSVASRFWSARRFLWTPDTHHGHMAGHHWQWMVRAHTRPHIYSSLGRRLSLLIGPYIKKPDGFPFKAQAVPVISVDRHRQRGHGTPHMNQTDSSPVNALEYQLSALRHARMAKQWLAAQGVAEHLVGPDGPRKGRITGEEMHLEFALSNTEAALHVLPKAVPYYWSTEMASVVAEASRQYPLDAVLTPDRLRDECFWYWCDAPFVHMTALRQDGASSRVPIHGVAAGVDRTTGKPHLRVVGFERLDDGRVVSIYATSWLFGEKPGITEYSTTWLEQHGAIEDDDAPRRMFQFVLAAQQWLSQKILTTKEVALDRPARRRASRVMELVSSVKVIALRAYESSSGQTSERREIDWSHRWIVSGHWRKQLHPSTGESVPTWIGPHIKGPEDKPLKVDGARVFGVVR